MSNQETSNGEAAHRTSRNKALKIAVYAIAKNEERHVRRFIQSAREADMILVADTGSTDGTVMELEQTGATVRRILISPWRFDDARNAAMAMLPEDVQVCVSLDLDEVLTPGWRAAIERAWTPETTRLRYRFITSWTADGSPGTAFWNERIHARRGYRWQMPIHEVVIWQGDGDESVATCDGFEVHHHPDDEKSRANYLPMLQRAAAESPGNPRAAHYLGREYYFWKRYEEAIRELKRGLDMPQSNWTPQRAEACRMIGKCYDMLQRSDEALTWYWKAVGEHPVQREPWVDLSYALYLRQDFAGGYYAAGRALAIIERSTDYFSEPEAWRGLPHDLLSVCAWKLGLVQEAASHAKTAAGLDPQDERLQANWRFFQQREAEGNGDSSSDRVCGDRNVNVVRLSPEIGS